MKNQSTHKEHFFHSMLFIYGLLILIVFMGSFLRLQGLFTNSFAFTYDVGRDMLALQQIVFHHKIPLIGPTTGLTGVFYGPWWYYLIAIPFALSGGNPASVVFFMTILGIVTVLLGFYLGKKIGGKSLGFIFALFLSISPPLIDLSSQIWNPNIAPLVVLLIFIVLYFIDKDNMWRNSDKDRESRSIRMTVINFLFLGLLLGFLLDVEIVFGVLFFISICVFMIIFLRLQLTMRNIISSLVGILFILSPRILFDFRHQFLMTKILLSSLHSVASPQHASLLVLLQQRILFLFYLWNDTLAGHNPFLGFVLLFFVLITSILFFKRRQEIAKRLLAAIFVILVVYLLGLTLFAHDLWPHYVVGIPIIYIFLFSLSIWFWLTIPNKLPVTLLIIFLLTWINVRPLQIIGDFQKPLWEGDASVYRNQLTVIDYIYHEAHGQKFKYILYTPPIYDYTYQYHFLWYGKNKYGYEPEKNNAHLLFVIIEPDTEKPFLLQRWLDARKNDGKLIKERVVKGGIKVQTRID